MLNFQNDFSQLLRCHSEERWRDLVFKFGSDLGYVGSLVAMFPDHRMPVDPKLALLHCNYSSSWRTKYEQGNLWQIDPTVAHCMTRSTPLVWQPEDFSAPEQRIMYEEAYRHGIRAGIALPMHGAGGEFGILCFVTDSEPDKSFRRGAQRRIPQLSCLRDFVLESSLRFMRLRKTAGEASSVTRRELECLRWSAAGKTSWEIGRILFCSEATVNFHLTNLRRKFGVASRQQAVVKAIRLGLISAA